MSEATTDPYPIAVDRQAAIDFLLSVGFSTEVVTHLQRFELTPWGILIEHIRGTDRGMLTTETPEGDRDVATVTVQIPFRRSQQAVPDAP